MFGHGVINERRAAGEVHELIPNIIGKNITKRGEKISTEDHDHSVDSCCLEYPLLWFHCSILPHRSPKPPFAALGDIMPTA